MPEQKSTAARSLPARNRAAITCESLEKRALLSVSVNAAGWTVVTPEAGERVVYCSTSGSDQNNGLSPQTPVKSLGKAESLIRNHSGDQLLLKAGDTWNGNFVFWSQSGKSAQQPVVIGSYGTGARPTIKTGTTSGFTTGQITVPEVDYVDIIGVHFWANGRDPSLTSAGSKTNPIGIQFLTRSTGILVENCEIQDYQVNVNLANFMGPLKDVSIRRNIIIDAYATNAHAQGMYATGVTNLTIYGNLFDHNGWNTSVPGAVATYFNQDCYLSSDNVNCVIQDNIFSRAAGYGLVDRPGGIVQGNLFVDDPIGMSYGLVNGATTTAGGVSGTVSGNVFIGGANIGTMLEGQAMQVGNIRAGMGTNISNNIITQGISTAAPAIEFSYGRGEPNSSAAVGINDLSLKNNVFYDWTTAYDFDSGLTPGGKGTQALNRITISGNQFENLRGATIENHQANYMSQETFFGNSAYNTRGMLQVSTWVASPGTTRITPMPFLDPTRSVATYDKTIGGPGTVADFLSRAAGRSEQTWNAKYDASAVIAYISQGFGVGLVPAPVSRSATTTFQALQWDNALGVKWDNFKGLGYADGGDWAEYKNVDFGAGVTRFTATISALTKGGSIQLRLDSPTGKLVGTLGVKSTVAWSNYQSQTATVTGATGLHNLYLVFVGGKGVANVNTFTFS